METINHSTCTVCIYYDQSLWHRLLADFIKPFLNEEIGLARLRTYGVYLSDDRGDHIQLVIKSAEEVTIIQDKITPLLTAFLAQNPSERRKKQVYPAKGFFMDYYNNSFFFDKYAHHIINDHYADNINERISECIIEALGEDEVDQEVLYTFMIYMALGSVKAVYPELKEAAIPMQSVLNYLETPQEIFDTLKIEDNSNVFGQGLSQLFEHNKQILWAIMEDIWNEDGYPQEIKWMEKWVRYCRQFIAQSDFNKSYVVINNQVYHHLGFKMDRYILSKSSEIILNAFNQQVVETGQIISSHQIL